MVCLLFATPLSSFSATSVLSSQSYGSPIGCTPESVFNLVAGFTLDTFSSVSAPSTAHTFTILPQYNNGQGASFQVMLNGVGNLVVATSGLRPLTFFGSLQYSTGNNPDVSNTIGVIGETAENKLFLHGTQVVTPCASTNCLHNYLFSTTGAGPGIDTNFTIPSANAGQGTLGGVYSTGTFSGNLFYLHRLVTPPNTTMLWQFDSAATTTLGFTNVGNITSTEMVQTSDSVYFAGTIDNTIKKVTKSGLVLTSFPITPVNVVDSIAYYSKENVFYIATTLAGNTTIRRYTGDFSTNTHNLVIGTEVISPFGLMVDETAQKVYLVSEVGGTKRIRRLTPSTLAIEQTLSIPTLTNGFVAAPDFTNRNLWISDIGAPSHIQQIQLCT